VGKKFTRGGSVDLSIDTSDLDRIRNLVSPREFSKIQRSALRYAASSVRPAVGKGISSRYGIKSGRVKEDSRVGPIVSTNGLDFHVDIAFSRRPPTGMQYAPREVGGGLSLQIFRSGRTRVKGGFLQTTRRGQQLTFKPAGGSYGGDTGGFMRAGERRNKPRRSLEVVHGPSTGSIFLGRSKFGDQIKNEVDARAGEQYEKGAVRAYEAMMRGFGR
jgi:hypothetical protein